MEIPSPGRQPSFHRNGRFSFFKGFLRHPSVVGSITPSSRFLERRIVAKSGIAQARMVVELGPGTGGTTQAILNALPDSSRLLALEIDPNFAAALKSLPDPRLHVHLGSAEQIGDALAHYGLQRPDAVVSGIPFSTMPAEDGRRILRAIWACLQPGGCFVAYQFLKRVAELDQATLGPPEVAIEFLNVPPVRLFRWQKPRRNGGSDVTLDAADGRHSAQAFFPDGARPV
jgi:phospholipid N-methyltransferase